MQLKRCRFVYQMLQRVIYEYCFRHLNSSKRTNIRGRTIRIRFYDLDQRVFLYSFAVHSMKI